MKIDIKIVCKKNLYWIRLIHRTEATERILKPCCKVPQQARFWAWYYGLTEGKLLPWNAYDNWLTFGLFIQIKMTSSLKYHNKAFKKCFVK